jgi:GDP-L-fucose synthase
MQIILVTGGTGLVGSGIRRISEEYIDKYKFIFMGSKDCNLMDYEETKEYFRGINPDYVIHLAANVGGLFKNMNYKVEMLDINLIINRNVLKCSHELGIKKLVSSLSTCIFPDKTTYPINEEMLHNGPPHYSNDAYAYAKRMLEIQSKTYQEQYGDNFICIIPTNIYGPHDNFNLEDGHVIPALINKCYNAKERGESFIVAGTGMPLRQFIYSEDLAKLIMYILLDYNKRDSIILSVNEEDEVSIKRIADIIAKKFDYREGLIFDGTKPDGQYKKTADNRRLRSFLEDNNINFKFTDIEEGINRTVDWFIENYKNARK